MPLPSNLSQLLCFGVFQVDLRAGELRKNGVKVKLQEQPFQVLCLLLDHPGELVSREEFRNRLWPADTFVDFDHGLNAAIKRLRDALGDSADSPAFIETLARRGYRFIAPVEGGAAPGAIELVPVLDRARSESTFFRSWVAIVLLSPIVIALLGWALWRSPQRPPEVIERKLTSNLPENSVTGAALSPDSKYLAYSDNTGLYLKLIRTGETHALSVPPNFVASVDDWFPDGSHLLVTRHEQPGKYSLWTISVFGGSPRQLTDSGAAGSVSPDGTHIAFDRYAKIMEKWVMRSDGTELVKVATGESTWLGQVAWSPDGTRIAYVRSKEDYNARESSMEVNDWKNARAETLFSDNHLGPATHWLPNGSLIYTLGDTDERRGAGLWMVSLQPSGKIVGAPKCITQGKGWISQLTGSHDGKVLTFVRGNSLASAYIGTLAPDGTRLLANKRLTLDENDNAPFSWTPDSKAILFHSDRNGTPEIFRQGIDQNLPESLMISAEQLVQPRLTPDGSEILYMSTPKSATLQTPTSLFAIPIGGGTPRLVLQDVGMWNVQCARLPSTLCMYSITKGSNSETFRFDVRSGKTADAAQIDAYCNWSLSRDGSQRAIVPADSKGIVRLRSTLTGETRELAVKGWNELSSVEWSNDGKSLLLTWNLESDSALLNVTLDGRVSVLLRSVNPQILGAIQSPDGRFLTIAEASNSQNVWKIENFRQLAFFAN
jgi:DNA-binding winged helix-turn-helix (wHTH) protein/Tol biopolymer transport system component